jgi:Nif-specific regulatory protein
VSKAKMTEKNIMVLYKEMERKIKLKDVLIDVTHSIEKVFVLKDVFDMLMKKLADKFGIIRGMLVLMDKEDNNKLSVVTAFNLTEDEMSRGIYVVGEGVVGKVFEDGKPISIPDINKDRLFLNRMKIKRDKNKAISFTAVPVKISGLVIGVLAIEKYFEDKDLLKDEEDMLFLLGNLIANKVKIYQKMSEEKSFLLEENLNLKKELYKNYGIDNIIGKSKKMEDVFELIKLVADSNSSIMILGASGTGKELVAKALHFNSSKKYGPFVGVNCAAIPENLLEAELFGYKKGAFTGASADKKGKFVLADGGTLFLDEIGDMPMYLQAKLLRAIQEKEVEPVGSESKIKVDIRIISATNREPMELIKGGKLREDLYYRLNVVEIKVPLLKERKEDVPVLVQHFIEKYSKENNRKIKRISPEALRILQTYNWPGNVRELENVIERAVLLSKDNSIDIESLPAFLVETGSIHAEELFMNRWVDNLITDKQYHGGVHDAFMRILEKELISKSLLYNNRNKIKTSDFLGINRNTLNAKIKKYDINI